MLVDDGNIEVEELIKAMHNIEISMKKQDILQDHPYYYDFARDEIRVYQRN